PGPRGAPGVLRTVRDLSRDGAAGARDCPSVAGGDAAATPSGGDRPLDRRSGVGTTARSRRLGRGRCSRRPARPGNVAGLAVVARCAVTPPGRGGPKRGGDRQAAAGLAREPRPIRHRGRAVRRGGVRGGAGRGEAGTAGWRPVMLGLAALGPLGVLLAAWRTASAPRPRRETMAAWAFLAPSALHLAAFCFVPLLLVLYVSVHRWSPIEPTRA